MDCSPPGIKHMSLMSPALADVFFTTSSNWETPRNFSCLKSSFHFLKILRYFSLKVMDTCICMAESLHCSPENITTLLIGYAAAAAKLLQSCPTLCDPIDSSPPASSVPGILQERTLEWVAISFSNAWKWKVKVKSLSRVRFLATPWTVAYQAPPPMGFPRQEYWSGVPLPSLPAFMTFPEPQRVDSNSC